MKQDRVMTNSDTPTNFIKDFVIYVLSPVLFPEIVKSLTPYQDKNLILLYLLLVVFYVILFYHALSYIIMLFQKKTDKCVIGLILRIMFFVIVGYYIYQAINS